MSKQKYNVIWIDDEFDKMSLFIKLCNKKNIHLQPFRTRKEGMDELNRNLNFWDAVLLDAKMFDESEHEQAKLHGLRKAISELNQLSLRRYIPYFISTGQPDLLNNDMFEQSFGKYYEKVTDDDILIEDIITTINNTPKKQIEIHYKDLFTAIDNMGMHEDVKNIVTSILMPLHYPADFPTFDPMLYYNQLRRLLEYLFRVCNKIKIIPDECIPLGKVNLNQCSHYLSGNNAIQVGVRYSKEGDRIIPKHLEYSMRSILELGNIHSHTIDLNEDDTALLKDFFRFSNSRYFLFGLTLQLFEILMWFNDYIKVHQDIEKNIEKCTKINFVTLYEGMTVEPNEDDNGIWHYQKCMIAIKYWEKGKLMRLKDIQQNTSEKTKEMYPYFAKYDKI